jgi:hypothetical protein
MRDSARWLAATALLALAACGRGDGDDVRQARLAAERRGLSEALDRLEDRLIVNQARVRLWREMRDRHESVSAVACASQEGHAEEMARVLERDNDRTARRQRVAHAGIGELGANATSGRN